jgi:hypothetical protein
VASADPPAPPHPGPAMFDPTEWCWIFDINWEWYYLEDCTPQVALWTNSQTGMINFAAKGQLPDGAALPEQGAYVVTYDNSGFACWWDDNTVTTNYSIVITPQGNFNISCHFMPGKWQPD